MNAETQTTTSARVPTNEEMALHLPLVHQVVRRMIRRMPSNVRQEDLFSSGLLGLYDALRKNSSEEAGPQFEWYARVRIRGAILDELRAQDWLPRRARWIASGRREAAPSARNVPSGVVGIEDLSAHEQASQLVDKTTLDSGAAIDFRSDCASLRQAIDSLPERERTIVRLHYFQDVRFKDIGALLGVSEPRISQLHSRAVERLRVMMDAAETAA